MNSKLFLSIVLLVTSSMQGAFSKLGSTCLKNIHSLSTTCSPQPKTNLAPLAAVVAATIGLAYHLDRSRERKQNELREELVAMIQSTEHTISKNRDNNTSFTNAFNWLRDLEKRVKGLEKKQ